MDADESQQEFGKNHVEIAAAVDAALAARRENGSIFRPMLRHAWQLCRRYHVIRDVLLRYEEEDEEVFADPSRRLSHPPVVLLLFESLELLDDQHECDCAAYAQVVLDLKGLRHELRTHSLHDLSGPRWLKRAIAALCARESPPTESPLTSRWAVCTPLTQQLSDNVIEVLETPETWLRDTTCWNYTAGLDFRGVLREMCDRVNMCDSRILAAYWFNPFWTPEDSLVTHEDRVMCVYTAHDDDKCGFNRDLTVPDWEASIAC